MAPSTSNRASGRAGGLGLIVASTAVAGAGGYAITAIAARGLGETYGAFAIFWSALYLLVGALSGVQQEIARSTEIVTPHEKQGRDVAKLPVFAVGVAVTAAIAVTLSSPLWAGAVFGESSNQLVAPLIAGGFSYVLVAAVSGAMYGTHLWRPLAGVIMLDVALRLGLITLGLLFNADVIALAWLTVAPFPLVVLAAVIVAGGRLRGHGSLDVGYRSAASHVSRTIVAAASTAMLVSGFPLLLGVSSPDESARALSAIILALILTRAPLVVSTLALQSYLVIRFKHASNRVGRLVAWVCGAIALAGMAFALLAWWLGVDVIVWVAGELFAVDPLFLGLLVAASIPTAWLAVCGAAVLARGLHSAYATGWLVAAIGASAALFLPIEGVEPRLLLALACGPLVGLAIHLIALKLPARKSRLELPNSQVL